MDKENAVHTHTQEYHSAIKNETMPFTATQMDPETIIPSEASQIKTNTKQHCLHVESKNNDPNEPAHKRERLIDPESKPNDAKGEKAVGEGRIAQPFFPSTRSCSGNLCLH